MLLARIQPVRGEAVASGAADFNSLAILGEYMKIRGLDESALAAELVEQIVDTGDP